MKYIPIKSGGHCLFCNNESTIDIKKSELSETVESICHQCLGDYLTKRDRILESIKDVFEIEFTSINSLKNAIDLLNSMRLSSSNFSSDLLLFLNNYNLVENGRG